MLVGRAFTKKKHLSEKKEEAGIQLLGEAEYSMFIQKNTRDIYMQKLSAESPFFNPKQTGPYFFTNRFFLP